MTHSIVTATRTDSGRVRRNNEDAVAVEPELGLLVLADGMGGHNAGEVASRIATATVLETVRMGFDTIKSDPAAEAPLLRRAVQAANAAIHTSSLQNPQQLGMGTTVVACLLREDRLSIAHVGDSRLYRLRGGRLTALTRDHSLVEAAVARGDYSREEAVLRLGRHVLARALGTELHVEIDLAEDRSEPGDIILLCSDGLTDCVDDAGIERTLIQFANDLDAAAAALIDAANAGGGRDNISVALARVEGDPLQRHPDRQRTLWQRLTGR